MDLGLSKIRIFRYAIGVTLAIAVSQGYAWPLSFLVPVLILSNLSPPAKGLSFAQGLKFIFAIGIACLAGLLIGKLIVFPFVYLPLMFLIFVHLFYAKESTISPLLKTWLIITILLLPMLSLSSPNLPLLIAPLLLLDAIVTIIITWIVYLLFPNPKTIELQLEKTEEIKEEAKSKNDRFFNALESTLVIFPVMVVFNLFQWNGAILILIFVAILSGMPALAKDFKVGKFLILGNTIGGVFSIIIYNIVVVVPELFYLILLLFLSALLVGSSVMSQKVIGKIVGSAFSTTLVILGSVFSSEDDAGSLVWIRVFQIFIAVTYVVFAFGFIEQLKKHFRNKKNINVLKDDQIIIENIR